MARTLKQLFHKFLIYLNTTVPPWKKILVYFLITRALLSVIGASSQILLAPFHAKEDVWHYSSHRILAVWGVWDTGWYLNIAHRGYSPKISTNEQTKNQANFAFFPLFPLSIRFLGKLFVIILSLVLLFLTCVFWGQRFLFINCSTLITMRTRANEPPNFFFFSPRLLFYRVFFLSHCTYF